MRLVAVSIDGPTAGSRVIRARRKLLGAALLVLGEQVYGEPVIGRLACPDPLWDGMGEAAHELLESWQGWQIYMQSKNRGSEPAGREIRLVNLSSKELLTAADLAQKHGAPTFLTENGVRVAVVIPASEYRILAGAGCDACGQPMSLICTACEDDD